MAYSLNSIDEVDCEIARINRFKYYDNSKGSTLVTDTNSNIKVVPPGVNNQVLVAKSSNALGVEWMTLPTTNSITTSNLTGAILTVANGTSYTLYNPHTVTLGDVINTYVEIQFSPMASKLIAINVIPASTFNWPIGTNYTFAVGYLRGTISSNPPNQFSTVTGSTCSFVPIPGATLTVGNSFSNTRTSATAYLNVNVNATEYLCMRCINSAATAGTILTATMWLRGVSS
jgi:hypothetical protein